MKSVEIIAELFGAVAIIVYVLLYQSSDMKTVLKKKRLMDILWGIHFLLIGGYSAVVTNSVAVIRETVFINRDKVKIFQRKIWLFIFIVLMWIGTIFTWQGIFSILPVTASTVAIFSFWQKNVKNAKLMGIIINILQFIYNFHIRSYMGMLAEIMCFISTVISLVKNTEKNKTR